MTDEATPEARAADLERRLRRTTAALARVIKHERLGDGDGGKWAWPKEIALLQSNRKALTNAR